ncbi:MAG: LolA-related protein [Gammaproteobacteria bacterium]
MMAVAVIFLAVFPAAAADSQFEAILARIDTPRGVSIPFVEKRKNPLLEEPLVLTGEVAFDQDGRLSKTIESPFRERVTISRDAVELERDGRTRRLSLRRKDDVRAFYIALRALLEGDAKALNELFEIETTTDAERWTLVLVPAGPPLSEFLESMVISGHSAQVSRIRTVQSEDDWQEMTFDTGGAE